MLRHLLQAAVLCVVILVLSYSAWLPGMSSFRIPSFVIDICKKV